MGTVTPPPPSPVLPPGRGRHTRRVRRPTATSDAALSALAGLVALVVYALHGYDGALDRDYGLFVYGGEQVARGVPPYLEVFNTVGPLADALPGLAIWLGHAVGADPVYSARVLYTVIAAACCALVAVLARDVLRSRAAALLAVAVFLPFGSFLQLATDGPRDKTAMTLFLLASLICTVRRRWFAAGVATALATLTWQPSFLVAAVAAGVTLTGAPSARLRGLAAYLVGGAVPTAVVIAFYTARGDLRVAIDGFLVVNAEYTRQPSLLGNPGRVWPILWNGYHVELAVLVAGLLVLLVRAVRAAPAAARRDPDAVTLAALGAGALAGTVWTVLVVNGAPDLFELLPFAALGAASGLLLLARRLGPPGAARLVASVVTVALVAALAESVATRNTVLVRQRADVAAVLAAAPPHSTVLSVDAPEVLAVAQLHSPLRYQLFDRRMRSWLDATTPGGLATYAAWVDRNQPELVAVDPQYLHTWLDPVLAADYVWVGPGPGWTWYVSRSTGPATIAAVGAANAAVMDAAGLDGQRSLLAGKAPPVGREPPRPTAEVSGSRAATGPARPAPGVRP